MFIACCLDPCIHLVIKSLKRHAEIVLGIKQEHLKRNVNHECGRMMSGGGGGGEQTNKQTRKEQS